MSAITIVAPVANAVTDDPRWAAMCAKDPAADGRFFYSVRTTGVYCRPSCGARAPRPENVRFHATRAEAERAGFRPCRRCRPDLAPLAERQAALVAALCRRIDEAPEPPTLDELSRDFALSPHHLHRVFKAVTGLTPRAYAAARRAERMRGALGRGQSVTRAIHDAGYGSTSRFYSRADDTLGMTPTAYRAGGAGVSIRYARGACALGEVLVAQSERGVCAILLGDDGAALVHELRERFPHAKLLGTDAALADVLARAVAMVEAPARGFDLPLDLRGTAFQHRVWQALREIPAGVTTTYTELARRIGAPTSVRAVAGACAANPLAIAIPCHRVVRGDGGLAGYRWGIERKRALLERESADR